MIVSYPDRWTGPNRSPLSPERCCFQLTESGPKQQKLDPKEEEAEHDLTPAAPVLMALGKAWLGATCSSPKQQAAAVFCTPKTPLSLSPPFSLKHHLEVEQRASDAAPKE
ncbi:TPA: hypothetical protein ACH3X2_001544 [Trebouxia sp. C0005]